FVDVFGHGVLFHAGNTEFATNTGLLESAPLCLRQVWVVVVDPDGTVTQFARNAGGDTRIGRPDCAGQTVVGVIGNGDGFIFGRESLDGDDRAKALFNNRGVVCGALVQHGWRIEKAIFVFWSTPVATDAKTCTGFNAAIDIVGDFIAVLSRDQWSGFGFVIERPTHNNVAGTAHQFIDELFCDGVLNDQTGTGGADESRIKEAGIQRIVQCSFEVCISKDHVGILAAKFQRYVLDGVGGGFG